MRTLCVGGDYLLMFNPILKVASKTGMQEKTS